MSQSLDIFPDWAEDISSEGEPSREVALTSEAKADLERQRAKTKEIEDRNQYRYKYANRFMRISYCSLILVGVMVIADGLMIHTTFDLSDTVLVALLGTALSTVFAPIYLLAKYLFKHDEVGNGK